MWRVYAIVSAVCALTAGVRLYPCGDAGHQDVVENTDITFYCDGYNRPVDWRFNTQNSTSNVPFSTCNTTSCIPSDYPLLATVTFINATSSSLTTSRTARTPVQSGTDYQCGSDGNTSKCGLHVTVPAVVSQPVTTITRQDSGYTLSLSANISQVYSSRGIYSCVWQLGTDRRTPTPVLSPESNNTSNMADRSGRCVVTMPLPNNTGDYSCSVTISPGNTHKSCGNITITRPSPPTISCPTDVIAENTSLNCTCNTNNIGQPGGRLRWYKGSGSNVNILVNSGNYDNNYLTMANTLVSRRDHNVTKFQCVNSWNVSIPGQIYTAQVAWGPDVVTIQGDTTLYTDTSGSKSLTLTCKASQVNPTSAMTYSWNITCDITQQSTCTFKPRPPGPGNSGDVNRVITCTVTNVNNKNREQHSSVTLDLKYPPWSAPLISSTPNTSAVHPNTSLNLTCTVTGGDPVVTSVSLTCPGRYEQNATSGQSSSLVITHVTAADHNLVCVCRGHWVNESVYTLTTSRTLIVYSPPMETTLLVNDNNVSVMFQENEAVTLVCKSRGVPAPRIELLQGETQLARQDGGSLSEESSQLSYKMTANCKNTHNVTCRAYDGNGHVQQATVEIYVNCSAADAGKDRLNAVTLGAGLGAGLAVLVIVVIIVVCCVCRRRNKKDTCQDRNESNSPQAESVGQAAVIPDPPRSPYEDFDLEVSVNPHVSPQPQPGPSSPPPDNAYAVVRKPNRAPPAQAAPTPFAATAAVAAAAAAVDDVNNEYAVVDKSRKSPAVSPSPNEPGPSGTHTPRPDAAPTVTVVRFNPGIAPEESVYENQAFQGDDNGPPATSEAASGGRTVNADGLVYTTVDFPENYQQKGKGVPAPLDMTDYTHINFVSRAQAAKKKKRK